MRTWEIVDSMIENKGYSNYKLFDKFVCDGYPESYIFIETIGPSFEVGAINRTDRKSYNSFENEEEALMLFMNKYYLTKVINTNLKDITDKYYETKNVEKQQLLLDICPSNIKIDFKNFSIEFYDRKIEKKLRIEYLEKSFITRTAFATLCIIISFEMVRNEMIRCGISKNLVNSYFMLEDALDKNLNITSVRQI